MFVGGSDIALEKAKEVLDTIGKTRRVGKYGNGYVAKLVNNQLWKIHASAIGEAMVLAKKAGLNLTPAGATFPYGVDPQDEIIRLAPTACTIQELEQAMQVFNACVALASVKSKVSSS